MKSLFVRKYKDCECRSMQMAVELLTRVSLGYVFIESGYGKLKDLPKVVEYFESLQIPLANIQAPMVSIMELVFGFFLVVGFLTRASAFFLIGIMAVALLTAKKEDITSVSDLLGLIEFLYILLLAWLFSYGSKAISVDLVIKRKCPRG